MCGTEKWEQLKENKMEFKHFKDDRTDKDEIINEEKWLVISLAPIKYLKEVLEF